MKKISLLTAAVLSVSGLSGCTFGASIDTLMAPPKLSVEQEQIYSALTNSEGTAISLKYPKSGKYLSAFIIEDIDGDGGNEAIVFYERTNHAADENPLRINILDKDENGWHSGQAMAAEGSEIEKVIISKLGTNDRLNIIIGTSLINRSEKNVSIYNYADGVLQDTTFSNSYSFFDVTDLDMDGHNEFLRLTGASGGEPAVAEAYELNEEGKYYMKSQLLSGNFTEFDNISYGKVGSKGKGLYIDALSGTGTVQTDIIYMERDGDDFSLKKVFDTPEESAKTIRTAGCSSFDVDGDGKPDMPFQFIAPCYEGKAEGEQLKLTEWKTINSDNKLEHCYTSYYSLNDGYIFIFPEKWENKVTIKRDIVKDEIVFCTYSDEGIGRELLRIFCAEDPPSREDRITDGYMLMHSKGESSYLACIGSDPDTENDGLNITPADAAIGFRFRD